MASTWDLGIKLRVHWDQQKEWHSCSHLHQSIHHSDQVRIVPHRNGIEASTRYIYPWIWTIEQHSCTPRHVFQQNIRSSVPPEMPTSMMPRSMSRPKHKTPVTIGGQCMAMQWIKSIEANLALIKLANIPTQRKESWGPTYLQVLILIQHFPAWDSNI